MREKSTQIVAVVAVILCLWFGRAELYQWAYRQIHADCLPRRAVRYGVIPEDGVNPMRTATRPTPNKPTPTPTPKATPKTREIVVTFPDDGGTEHQQ